jgi:8-oxo-dGTP diphosphatase
MSSNTAVMEDRPKVGVGVIVRQGGKVLLGLRRNAHGEGTWSFPGGHLEFGEDVFTCARREVAEETGLEISGLQVGPWTSDVFQEEGKHYVTLFVIAESAAGTPETLEPEKCIEWRWFFWSELPRPLFLPIQNLLAQGFEPRV